MTHRYALEGENGTNTEQETREASQSRRAWLASLLLGRRYPVFTRFLNFYQRILNRPRHIRRRLVRRGAITLAGVALALALVRSPAHAATITVDNGEVGIADNDVCSLIEAINNANYGAQHNDCEYGDPYGLDYIELPDNGLFTLDSSYVYYQGETGLPLITSEIIIEANNSIIERDSTSDEEFRLFAVTSSGDLTINDATLRYGFEYDGYGGAAIINFYGELTVNNSIITGNYAFGPAGIGNYGGTILISGSTLTYNIGFGGAAVGTTYGGETTIEYSDVNHNYGFLAPVTNYASRLIIRDSTLSYNDGFLGGAVATNNGTTTISNSLLYENYADYGGAVYVHSGTTNIHNTVLSYNWGIVGGAAYNEDGVMNIIDSLLTHNYAEYAGGAVYNEDGTVNISGSTLSGNEAYYEDGGAVFNDDGQTTIVNSTISGNMAGDAAGGVRQQDETGVTTIINTTITDNTAADHGGGIDAVYGTLILERSIVSGNHSPDASEIHIHNYGDDSPTVTVDAHNLFGDSGVDNEDAFYNFTPGSSDITATSDGNTPTDLSDILDTDLDDNGGPQAGITGFTVPIPTHNLDSSASPAVDAAPSGDCFGDPVDGVDQRGYARNFDGDGNGDLAGTECDIGAIEYGASLPVPLEGLFLTAEAPGTTSNGINFGTEDILEWDGSQWSLFFDGSAAGLKSGNKAHDINGIHVNEANDIYLTFFQNKIMTADLGQVFGHDIIHYDGSDFSFFFDGSDLGLSTVSEKLDGLHIVEDDSGLPGGGACTEYILVSTFGTGKVPAAGGGQLSFQGEDVLGFCAASTGTDTAGSWYMVLDGSAEGMPKNATFSLSANEDASILYFTTKDNFNVPPAVGGHSMVYQYDMATDSFSGPLFSAPANGLNQLVNGLHVAGDLP